MAGVQWAPAYHRTVNHQASPFAVARTLSWYILGLTLTNSVLKSKQTKQTNNISNFPSLKFCNHSVPMIFLK